LFVVAPVVMMMIHPAKWAVMMAMMAMMASANNAAHVTVADVHVADVPVVLDPGFFCGQQSLLSSPPSWCCGLFSTFNEAYTDRKLS
jgi:hypothetical protein